VSGKGYHFPNGPYVEYIGDLGENKDDLLCKVQAEVDRLIAAETPIVVYDDCDDAKITGMTYATLGHL